MTTHNEAYLCLLDKPLVRAPLIFWRSVGDRLVSPPHLQSIILWSWHIRSIYTNSQFHFFVWIPIVPLRLTISDLVIWPLIWLWACIFIVACCYHAFSTTVYQRLQEGQELLGSVCEFQRERERKKNVLFFWENLKCKNKMLQGIVDTCCSGHLNLHCC